MDPITGLIFVLGVLWAARGSGRAVARSHRNHRAKAKQNAATHGTARNRAGSGRRRANAATLGYWAGEARHGFPDIKHGWQQGWREHQLATAQRETETAQHRADHQGLLNNLRAQAAAHQHRLEVAARQHRAGPTMSQQLRAVPPREYRQPGDTPPGGQMTSPFPRGFTFRDPHTHHLMQVIDDHGHLIDLDDPQNGHDPMTCKNPDCECHQKQHTAGPATPLPNTFPVGQSGPSAPPSNGGSAPVSDFNYDESVKTADELITAAEHGISDDVLDKATQMADGLAGVIPNDSTTQGQAGEVAQTAEQIKALHKQLQDQAVAMKDRLTTTYGPTHEAVQGSGERAAQPEFHDA